MNGQTLQKAFVSLPGQATVVYTSSGLDHYRHSDWLGSARLTSGLYWALLGIELGLILFVLVGILSFSPAKTQARGGDGGGTPRWRHRKMPA